MKSKITGNPTKDQTKDGTTDSCRLDTWLWASRFYKSRKIATEAIKGGHVEVNGQKGKPGKNVRSGDQLSIKKHQLRYDIQIQRISEKRLGAPLAKALYLESQESITAREEHLATQKQLRASLSFDPRRPSKRDRQSMLRLKQHIADN